MALITMLDEVHDHQLRNAPIPKLPMAEKTVCKLFTSLTILRRRGQAQGRTRPLPRVPEITLSGVTLGSPGASYPSRLKRWRGPGRRGRSLASAHNYRAPSAGLS